MAGQLSNKGEQNALAALFNGSSVYLALSTAVIDDTTLLSGLVEPTDSSYTTGGRKQITFGAPSLVSGSMTVSNTVAIDYPAWAADASAKILYAAVVTAASGTTGDILAWFSLDTVNQIQPLSGQPVKVPVGGITISIE